MMFWILVAFLTSLALWSPAADPSVAEIVLQNMDPNVSPCADFYNYSCTFWLL